MLLSWLHAVVKNWGLAIIFATLLLKLLFYPLAQYAGRSMARMRKLAPRMKALQETYKDDREKLGRAMMDLYKTREGQSAFRAACPCSSRCRCSWRSTGCCSRAWKCARRRSSAGSMTCRRAIRSSSCRRSTALAMWGQYKLNPPPPDPVQAKVFQFMPLVFSVMFALFPAGLVLYWVTNTGLSILQQWNINRTIEAEDKARKK